MMPEYRIYFPSPEGYSVFRRNLIKSEDNLYKRENAFLKEFSDNPKNTDAGTVKRRVTELNRLYSTRASGDELVEVVNLILHMNFEQQLDEAGYKLMELLRHVPSSRVNSGRIDHLSLASKYCHHCRPDKYPIYDSVNVRVLSVYFGYKDKRDYEEYVKCFKAFCSFLGYDELKDNEGFYIDKYIQAIGTRNELPRASIGVS